MSDYDDKIFDSDLDAFKNSGQIKTASLVISGSITAGDDSLFTTAVTVPDLDLFEIMFDSSTKHSGKFKAMKMERYTLIYESTNGSELTLLFEVSVSGDVVTIGGRLFNLYATPVTLQTTTINFRLIPYEGTF